MDTEKLFKDTIRELEVTKEEHLENFKKKVNSFLEICQKNFSFLTQFDYEISLYATPKNLFEEGIYLISIGIKNFPKTLETLIFTEEQDIKDWKEIVYLVPTEFIYRRDPETVVSKKQLKDVIHPMKLDSFIEKLAQRYHSYQLYISEKK